MKGFRRAFGETLGASLGYGVGLGVLLLVVEGGPLVAMELTDEWRERRQRKRSEEKQAHEAEEALREEDKPAYVMGTDAGGRRTMMPAAMRRPRVPADKEEA